MVKEGDLLWHPPDAWRESANITHFFAWLRHKGHSFLDYEALWQWSVTQLEDFWASVWEYFDILSPSYERVLKERCMPGAQWFVGTQLNYVEQVFRHRNPHATAIWSSNESGKECTMTWLQLENDVARLAGTLRELGVEPGDRVAAYLPNIPEAVIAFLATASIGAIWSVCSPDFGASSVIDRFRQINPKVLIACTGYRYNGKVFDRKNESLALIKALPTLSRVIYVDTLGAGWPREGLKWEEALSTPASLNIVRVPFDHPLWILYSSGTTGLPKPIVHGHGGMLLTHLVSGEFHMDMKPDDHFFWFTTTGWMMWNVVVSALLRGSTIILYDGSPTFPNPNALWSLAERCGMTIFGTSAAFLHGCLKQGLEPGKTHDLHALRSIGSTGSPLTAEGFEWVYQHVKADVWLAPASGGTDICAPLVAGLPVLPVYAGEMQCRVLGAKVEAYTKGQPVINEVGELVVTQPMPAMPLYFWDDTDFRRYRSSYFEYFPGVWRHGDFIRITSKGSALIYGRSDATINRYGVRFGSADVYRAVESMDVVDESLVVDLEALGRQSYMILFVKLTNAHVLTDGVRKAITEKIRQTLSPRHVPDEIIAVQDIPKTLNGKKMEVPVRKLLLGMPENQVLSRDAMSNPACIAEYLEMARRFHQRPNT